MAVSDVLWKKKLQEKQVSPPVLGGGTQRRIQASTAQPGMALSCIIVHSDYEDLAAAVLASRAQSLFLVKQTARVTTKPGVKVILAELPWMDGRISKDEDVWCGP